MKPDNDALVEYIKQEAKRQYPFYTDEAAYHCFRTYSDIISRAWDAALANHKPGAEPEVVTVEDLIDPIIKAWYEQKNARNEVRASKVISSIYRIAHNGLRIIKDTK